MSWDLDVSGHLMHVSGLVGGGGTHLTVGILSPLSRHGHLVLTIDHLSDIRLEGDSSSWVGETGLSDVLISSLLVQVDISADSLSIVSSRPASLDEVSIVLVVDSG